MYRETFQMFAGYNAWADERLYAAVSTLTPEDFTADRGLFFGSILCTLNHLLAADRIWMKRFTQQGEAPSRLDAILHPEFGALLSARQAEDARIAAFVGDLTEAGFAGLFTYQRMTDTSIQTQELAPALFHLFNHQTHHRGQCHAALTGLGAQAPSLDMVAFQRG